MTVLIAGAGIAGLSLGLTLHQIGVPFRIFEAVSQLRPLGVGINLQPNAVRELVELGLEEDLDLAGVRTIDYGFYTKHGLPIWIEPRGLHAGYRWPQYSIHRGELQMMLYRRLVERAGADCVQLGHRALGYAGRASGADLILQGNDGEKSAHGDIVVAADGIHSAIRHQMYPKEGNPVWSGAILWRGTTQSEPFLTGASMILAGHATQRIVAYPISNANADTGLATINWIAELKPQGQKTWNKEDWNRRANLDDFLPAFADWCFEWMDVPLLINGAKEVFEYPMVDRDPICRWTDGCVTLMGDAAHPTYPVGSNGASQAIVDARILGAEILRYGECPDALLAYEQTVRPQAAKIIQANRGSGPDAILQAVEDRCGGVFDTIEDVVSQKELAHHASKYKALAGFGIDQVNRRPPTIPAEAIAAKKQN